jgi:hypothetical protein
MLVALLFVASQALGSEGHDLTLQGDGSFSIPHGDQAIEAAIYDVHTGEVVATQSGTVSGSEDPSFSFTFSSVLQEGELYDVHYWIDSNFGGGSEGSCDPLDIDHQWRIALNDVSEAVMLQEIHAPAELAPVCRTFE